MRPVLLLARQQLHFAVVEPRLRTIAVEFDLVQPIRPARRLIVERSETERDEGGRLRFDWMRGFAVSAPLALGIVCSGLRFRSWRRRRAFVFVVSPCRRLRFSLSPCRRLAAILCNLLFERRLVFRFRLLRFLLRLRAVRAIGVPHPLLAALARGDLLDRAAGHRRERLFFQYVLVARAAGFLVLAFDQQPIVVTVAACPRAHAHQMPAAVQLLAVEIENEMALGVALVRIAFGKPAAAIPDHHGAAAIFAFGDRALEGVVFDRMILDMDGEAFFIGIEARAAGHRPALHHAVEFEPQIVMQPPRGVLLDHIPVPAAVAAFSSARFRRHAEFPLFPVSFERHGN